MERDAMETLTPRERELARHALGLDGRRKRSYRNRYFIDATTPTGLAWLAMVARGLAEIEPRPKSLCDLFYLTRAGARAALETGETLDREDFPG
jgi:hypothetical protein